MKSFIRIMDMESENSRKSIEKKLYEKDFFNYKLNSVSYLLVSIISFYFLLSYIVNWNEFYWNFEGTIVFFMIPLLLAYTILLCILLQKKARRKFTIRIMYGFDDLKR